MHMLQRSLLNTAVVRFTSVSPGWKPDSGWLDFFMFSNSVTELLFSLDFPSHYMVDNICCKAISPENDNSTGGKHAEIPSR